PRRECPPIGRKPKIDPAAAIPGARQAKLPSRVAPLLATLAETAPDGDNWLHEVKFDGYRILAFLEGGRVRLVSRNGLDWTSRLRRERDGRGVEEPLPRDRRRHRQAEGDGVDPRRRGRGARRERRQQLRRAPAGALDRRDRRPRLLRLRPALSRRLRPPAGPP